MAFALLTSGSALIPTSGAVVNFAVPTTVRSLRLTNTSASPVTVTLFFDYDGTAANPVDTVLDSLVLAGKESAVIDGGPFNFAAGGRITGTATTNNAVSLHYTPATI